MPLLRTGGLVESGIPTGLILVVLFRRFVRIVEPVRIHAPGVAAVVVVGDEVVALVIMGPPLLGLDTTVLLRTARPHWLVFS